MGSEHADNNKCPTINDSNPETESSQTKICLDSDRSPRGARAALEKDLFRPSLRVRFDLEVDEDKGSESHKTTDYRKIQSSCTRSGLTTSVVIGRDVNRLEMMSMQSDREYVSIYEI